MRIKKTTKVSETFVLEYGDSEIPIFDVFRSMMVFILIALAYNVGVQTTAEMLKVSAYFADKCEPVLREDNRLSWDCSAWEAEFENQQNFKSADITNNSKYLT